MSKHPPPTPTASAIGPCPTSAQISRTPRHSRTEFNLQVCEFPHYRVYSCRKEFALIESKFFPSRVDPNGEAGKYFPIRVLSDEVYPYNFSKIKCSYRKNSKIWDTSNNCHNCPKIGKV